jgi:cephalosporin hydroxylase
MSKKFVTDYDLKQWFQKFLAEQRLDEVIWFYRAVEKIEPKVIVEIGIKEGGNLQIMSTHLPQDGLAIGIDPRQDIPWDLSDLECKPVHIQGDSHSPETLKQLKALLQKKKIDVLFIDGDHSTQGMLADFKDYSPLVKKGGIIAVHDIFYLQEVKDAWVQIQGTKFESPWNQSSIGIGYIIK